jgi:hypothetical protein
MTGKTGAVIPGISFVLTQLFLSKIKFSIKLETWARDTYGNREVKDFTLVKYSYMYYIYPLDE